MVIFWTELVAAAGTTASRSYADLMCIRMVVIDWGVCVRDAYAYSSGGIIGHTKMRSIILFHEQGFHLRRQPWVEPLRRQLIATGGCKKW